MDSAALRALPACALMESLMVPGLSPGLAELLELIRVGRAQILSECADTISAGERGLNMRFSDLSAERFDLLRCTPTMTSLEPRSERSFPCCTVSESRF